MNTGVISSRYARALLAFSNGNGDADTACAQARTLLQAIRELPALRTALADPAAVSAAEKSALLRTALGGETMSPSLERFLQLVQQKGRMPLLPLILHDFMELYFRERDIHPATLTTAVPPTEELLEKYRSAAERRFGGTVRIQAVTDPAIIGGVVFTVDGQRLDASVAHQIDKLHSELGAKNKRIV